MDGCPHAEDGKGFGTINDRDRHHEGKHKDLYQPKKLWKCLYRNCSKREKEWRRLDNFKTHLGKTHAGVKNPKDFKIPEIASVVEEYIRK